MPADQLQSRFATSMEGFLRPAAGVYVHWPFCARKCPYCDFYTYGREHPRHALSVSYLAALESEAADFAARFGLAGPPAADALYLGGGTPSLMTPEELERLLARLHGAFAFSPGSEITLEVNPTAADAALLAPARRMGVNRLSIGCQSFDDGLLKLLGRDHDAAAARRTLRLARELGYGNVSLDLMFGLPGQTAEALRADLETALSFEPEHVSAYGLTYHEGTPFARWKREGRLIPAGEDQEAAQFRMIRETLGEAGYVHYEISNWSLPGRESRHNSKYWSPADVFALGASAHGAIRGRRYANPRELEGYLRAGSGAAAGRGELEPRPAARAAAGEIVMLALRRIEGRSWSELDAWLDDWIPEWGGRGAKDYYSAELEALVRREWIDPPERGRLRLSGAGLVFADSVMEEFF